MNPLKFVFITALMTKIMSGPFAAGWTCSWQCAAFVPGTPPFLACYAACMLIQTPILCFSENTTVITRTGIKQISQLQLGQQVLTADKDDQEKWTSIIFKQKGPAKQFVKIETDLEFLQITPEHVMIVNSKLTKAKDLKVGMMIQNKVIQKLSIVQNQWKVTLGTQSGTVLANGLLTTTLCGEYIDVYGNSLEVLDKWRESHKWLTME